MFVTSTRQPSRRRPRTAALAIGGVMLLAACSGSSPETTDDETATVAPTESVATTQPNDAAGPTTTEPVDGNEDEPDVTAPTGTDPVEVIACDVEPVVLTTTSGVDFVRTPDVCFDDLPDWPYESQYVEIDGLRQAYVDEGPDDGDVVLLLHGQPSWSYLYRDMIPVLVDAGHRVIAMDHLGMGRSDKPTEIESYGYVDHVDRLAAFIAELGLSDINLFVQDWGSLIGLNVAGTSPESFATIAVGDGTLPVLPAGIEVFPRVENPDEIADIPSPFELIPAQQVPFYDGCQLRIERDERYFADWMTYAMTAESFTASAVVEAMTWFDLTPAEEAAYDAPFPSREYMAGVRTFPSLVNEVPGETAEAWDGLTAFEDPFLTLWAANDPGQLGSCEVQQNFIDNVPGAAGQPHDRLPEASHFLQDDQGTEIATRLVAWYASLAGGGPVADADAGTASGLNATMEARRYCEVVLVEQTDDGLQAAVWGTQGLNRCPAERWDALDGDTIQAETGAVAVRMNGPRYGLMRAEGSIFESDERRTFGDLEMRFLTSIDLSRVDPSQTDLGPYTEVTVIRSTTFTFDAGTDVYELTAPDASVYVMQSMSQIVDPDLMLEDLAGLGDRLELPEGWSYAARTLEDDLVLVTNDDAVVIQDELQNSYQKRTDAGS